MTSHGHRRAVPETKRQEPEAARLRLDPNVVAADRSSRASDPRGANESWINVQPRLAGRSIAMF